jgi:hypothetical protein
MRGLHRHDGVRRRRRHGGHRNVAQHVNVFVNKHEPGVVVVQHLLRQVRLMALRRRPRVRGRASHLQSGQRDKAASATITTHKHSTTTRTHDRFQ